ncbi:MAG: UDP-N-acetylmuramate:L-alanyl-gamma-D-glutamyl-meso-diaminopimelate ligase [Acidobacteriia bacterium]|nr:UDP-N-acetylmuramate:L-alanyl-gamma-D-glutamyl-meso-diaminopimelate ligase [Terriglobia bacterium]
MSEHVHLIGIGGTGMAALAGLLHESGCRVTGSDTELYPPTSTLLEAMGLEIRAAYDARNLRPAPDLVVVGNAVRRGNPEAEEVLDRRLRHASMPQVLEDRFLPGRHSIVVSGTHGKTTTTAMLAWVLHHAGQDPGFLVGGLPANFDRPYRLGHGAAFVIEGDEYDTAFFDKGPKFMHYRPDTALVGTVEFDHADIYRDLEQVKTAFRWLVNIVPRRGLVIRHEDCETTVEVTRGALSRVEGYGLTAGLWRAAGLSAAPEGARFEVQRDGRRYAETALGVFGEFNVRNALAVVAAAAEQGLSPEEIAAGLASFRGVRRRLEVRGEADGVTLLDDFAHHPTAIAETLKAVRGRYPERKVWAVLEPRSWSLRRNVFQDRLAASFDPADEVLIAEVFGASSLPPAERLDPDRLAREISTRGRRARFLPGVDAIVAHLAEASRPGDVVAVLSNGGFGGIHAKLLAALETRAGGR